MSSLIAPIIIITTPVPKVRPFFVVLIPYPLGLRAIGVARRVPSSIPVRGASLGRVEYNFTTEVLHLTRKSLHYD